MKKIILLQLCALIICIQANAQEIKRITIVHTNDLHSHLQGFAPESEYTPLTTGDDKTVGGFARIASVITKAKAEDTNGTLVVDAGDCMMGTLFHAMEGRSGYQLQLMKRMGYDVVAMGNHDFDFGPASYAGMVSTAAKGGSIPQILAGNVITDPKDKRDDDLEKLFNSGLLKKYTIIEKEGIKIGIFSLIGKDAVHAAPYASPVKFSSAVKESKTIVRELKEKGCSIIICLSHSGVTHEKDGKWGGEDAILAQKVKGIDIIISGHTHTVLKKPVIINGVPVVQTGSFGRYVGKAVLVWDGKKAILDSYTLIPVTDDIKGDASIQNDIDKQKQKIDENILKPLGLKYSMPLAFASFQMTCREYEDPESSNLGPFVADAIYNYANTQGPGTDVAIIAAGIIRDPVEQGVQSVADIFRVMSLGSGKDSVPGYPLAQLWVTGHELKSIAEILIMSSASTPSNFCFYSHLNIFYNLDRGLFRKVIRLELTDFNGNKHDINTSRDDKRLYSIVANAYMLEFIGIIKKKSFGLINVVPKDRNGAPVRDMKTAVMDCDMKKTGIQEGKEWLALVNYLMSMGKNANDTIPQINQYYKKPQEALIKVK